LTHATVVVIGEIVKPHGIRGELSVASHACSPSFFAPGAALGLRRPGKPGDSEAQAPPIRPVRWVTVLSSRPHQGRVLVTLDGVGDRDAAEKLRGLEVVVEASGLPELAADEVYLHEITGFETLLPDGTPVGTLTGFLDVPGQDVWVIRAPGGKEILFPAHDKTVLTIDAKARRIVIDPPPGLLEL